MFKSLIVILLSMVLLLGCNTGKVKTPDETTTRGTIKIAVDESYQLLIDTQIYTFQKIYPHSSITAKYTTEVDAYDLFMKDSIRLMIVNRELSNEQKKMLNQVKIIPRTTRIAYDALAFILNKENKDTLLRYDQLQSVFNGNINSWKQIDKNSSLSNIKVVFDNNSSGNPRFIREKFGIKESFPDYCYAVNSNEEVINYVEKNKNAIGIISVNWISDRDDTLSATFLKKINIASIGQPGDTEGSGEFRKPYQGYIADGTYPFIRSMYAISRETFVGLGSGFIQFIAGDQGQRIVLKSGLVPATMPIRLVQIKK